MGAARAGLAARRPEPEIEKRALLVDGALAGYVQFYEEPDPTNRHADVDIFLGPDHIGRGLGTEAMRAIVRELTDRAVTTASRSGPRPTTGARSAATRRPASGAWA